MMFLADSESETVKKLEEFHPEVETEPSKGEEDIGAEGAGKGASSMLFDLFLACSPYMQDNASQVSLEVMRCCFEIYVDPASSGLGLPAHIVETDDWRKAKPTPSLKTFL